MPKCALLFGIFFILIIAVSVNPPVVQPQQEGDSRLTDMGGYPVTLTPPAERVMIFPPLAAHYATIDETTEHIAAVGGYLRDDAEKTVLSGLFPELPHIAEALTVTGSVPLGVEQILLLQPDAVLTWLWFSDDLARIHYKGLVRFTFDRDDGLGYFSLIGGIAGKNERAAEISERYHKKTAELTAQISGEYPAKVLVIANENLFVWNAAFTDFNSNLGMINAVNAAEHLSGTPNIEVILGLDPDIIFLNDYANALTVESIYTDPVFSGFKAVAERRVYRMPRGFASMKGPVEQPILFLWMALLIRPETELSLRREIKDTYLEIFNYEISEEETDLMLHIKENGGSRYYSIFKE
jgi:iron complex transport system substrate-binding protein